MLQCVKMFFASSSDSKTFVKARQYSDPNALVLIKDLKVKGANTTIKRGVVYENIRVTSSCEDGEVRDGKWKFVLKTCFLKRA